MQDLPRLPQIDQIEVLELLGCGGMSIVYYLSQDSEHLLKVEALVKTEMSELDRLNRRS